MNYFPFGQPLQKVQQRDKTSKDVFVLGVYASAVHASWLDVNGNQKVTALAVASEPEIFWTGHDAEEIISSISIPRELGKLIVPKNKELNGASGRALDNLYLDPLGLSRTDVWLCDLLPESRVNKSQRKALENHYTDDIIEKYQLNHATIPDFNVRELSSSIRREEILSELEDSKTNTIVLLGDLPIKWFLQFYNNMYVSLSQFGTTNDTYGCVHEITIKNKAFKVIPLCHPRQSAKLGKSKSDWQKLHEGWIGKHSSILI